MAPSPRSHARSAGVKSLCLLVCALALLVVTAPAGAAVTGQWKAVGTGQAHTCAISSDDHVSCWGLDSDHQLDLPGDLGPVTAISVGGWSTCAIQAAGSLRCWGDDYYGQSDVPPTLGAVSAVSVGVDNACAVRIDGSATCWGHDDWGKSEVPDGLGPVKTVSTGFYATCAVKVDGDVVCWGYDGEGGTEVPADLHDVDTISAGGAHACAVTTSGALECWGGRYGLGEAAVPADLGPVRSVSSGSRTTCAVTVEGAPRCWGYTDGGRADVAPGTFTAISTGSSGTICAVNNDTGALACWGNALNGATRVPTPPAPDTTGPVLTPDVEGTQGGGDWWRSDVSVTWGVSDPDSPVTAIDGCDDDVVAEDTDGTTFSCSATSDGGTTAQTVTIKRDTAPPQVAISGCPQGSVTAGDNAEMSVTASDALSGLAVDPSGRLALDTATAGAHTATATATDQAGNTTTAECDYSVVGTRPKPTLLLAPPGPARSTAPNNRGAFTLKWTPPSTTLGLALTYRLERRSAAGGDWSTIASRIAKSSYTFEKTAPEQEGTWVYRVTVDTPNVLSVPSADGPAVTVDRGAPTTPTLTIDPASQPAYTSPAGVPWFTDDVGLLLAAGADPADPALPDGSAGSGVKPFTATFTRTTSGLGTVSKTLTDRAGNLSAAAKLTLGIDKVAPRLAVTCPAQPVAPKATAYATYTASDAESGLKESPVGRRLLDTRQVGPQTATVTVHDHVGHATTATCAYTVS